MLSAPEVHHRVPRCLLRLFDRAAEGLADWSEFDAEAERWGVDPTRVRSRDELAALVEASTVEIPREEHREHHVEDFRRWGRRGGLRTYALYGAAWFAALGRRRWERISGDELAAAFVAAGGAPLGGRS